MTNKKTEAEAMPQREETATKPAVAAVPRPASEAAAGPAGARQGSKPKRLSKGQRKHVRRQKQAGEIKVTPRR